MKKISDVTIFSSIAFIGFGFFMRIMGMANVLILNVILLIIAAVFLFSAYRDMKNV